MSKLSKFDESVEEVVRRLGLNMPDEVVVDDEGNEEWIYEVFKGGRDDNGVYGVVLDGPAQGEKAYYERTD